jgi:hypothetical protein
MATKSKKTAKKIEAFDYTTIKSFEDACSKLGIEPITPGTALILDELKKPLIAAYKLMIIYKAINNGWKPDWNNYDQYKYYPWFGVSSSGFGFSVSDSDYDGASAGVGSRLCTDSWEKALYISKQFEAEYVEYFLYSE